MKRFCRIFPFACQSVLLLAVIFSWLTSRKLEFHPLPTAILLALCALASVFKAEFDTSSANFLQFLLVPIALFNAFVLFIKSTNIVLLLQLLCFGMAMVTALLSRLSIAAKSFLCILTPIPTLILLFFLQASFIAPGVVKTTEQSLPSPDGTHIAQVIVGDEGGLGGSTHVIISENKAAIPLGFATFLPPSQTVYEGNWSSHFDMTLTWQDNSILLINDTPYSINP